MSRAPEPLPDVERSPDARTTPPCGALARGAGCLSGYVGKLRKHRGADVPSYYVAIYADVGFTGIIIDSPDGWWTKKEAKAAAARWIAERTKPTDNIVHEPRP